MNYGLVFLLLQTLCLLHCIVHLFSLPFPHLSIDCFLSRIWSHICQSQRCMINLNDICWVSYTLSKRFRRIKIFNSLQIVSKCWKSWKFPFLPSIQSILKLYSLKSKSQVTGICFLFLDYFFLVQFNGLW